VGIRVHAATDTAKLQRCLEEQLDGRVRSRLSGMPRFTLRVRGVPIATVGKAAQLLARLDGDLKLLSQRVVSTSRFSATLDLEVEGTLSGTSWTLSGIGAELVVFERRPSRRGAPASVPVASETRPAATKPLSPAERQTWASIAAGVRDQPPPLAPGSDSSVTPTAVVNVIPDDAETPIPPRRRPVSPAVAPPTSSSRGGSAQSPPPSSGRGPAKPSASSTTAAPSSAAPFSNTPLAAAPKALLRRSGGIQAFLQPAAKPSSTPPPASCSSSASPPASVITSQQFSSLLAQVEQLTRALTEQAQANKQLQEQLTRALADSAALRRQLKDAPSKRPRSGKGPSSPPAAELPALPDGSMADQANSEASMSSSEGEPGSRRHSPGRVSPSNV